MWTMENRISALETYANHRSAFFGDICAKFDQQSNKIVPFDVLSIWFGKNTLNGSPMMASHEINGTIL